MSEAEAKVRLRAEMAARRRTLEPVAAERASRALGVRLEALDAWQRARSVMLYMPVRGEIDVSGLLGGLLERGVQVMLPRCRPDEPGVMDVSCVRCREDLVPGSYGILEPDPDACPALGCLGPGFADIIVVPGLAFDRSGFRLGFGGGYYDRLLACDGARAALTIGVGYAFQVVERLPRDVWDVPMRAVLTDIDYFETAS